MPDIGTLKDFLPTLLAVVGVLVLMGVGLWLSTRFIRRLANRMEEKNKEHIEGIERWAKQLTGFIRHAVEIVAGVAALLIILSGLGIRGVPQLRWEQVAAWLTGPGLRILFVLGGAFALVRILHLLIARFAVVTVAAQRPAGRDHRTTEAHRHPERLAAHGQHLRGHERGSLDCDSGARL